MITDKRVVQQIIGCLLKHPQYLSESDKYYLTPADFHSHFEKYLFTAIYGLYTGGAKKISAFDVENYLSTNESAKSNFQDNKGVEYLQDVEEFSNTENFPYYYDKLKKLNMLNSYQKMGIDISDFYIEDTFDKRADEVNKKFEDLTIADISNAIKKKILKIETDYVKTEEVQSWDIGDEVDEIIDNFGSVEDIGLSIQGSIYSKVINGAEHGALTIRSAPSGVGKAIPNYTIIPTPNGSKRVDEIKIGDYLWGADGKPTQVIGVHPQSEQKEIYKVYFKDGRIAECCKEHLWAFYNSNSKNKFKLNVTNTQELLTHKIQNNDGGLHYSIPLNRPLELIPKSLTPSPYAMGALLGDGSFRYQDSQKSLTISGQDEEIVALTARGLNANYEKNNSKNYTWTFKLKEPIKKRVNVWIEEALSNYPDLWNKKSNDKFIPKDYLEGSIEQRFELLRGLLDTDGTIDEKGGVSYFTNSKLMCQQVQQLCWSLGMMAMIAEDRHKTTSVVYILHIQCEKSRKPLLFNLTRKKNIAIAYANNKKKEERKDNNGIIKIEPTGIYTDMTCFTVDNDSHLFLMNDYIVTHNTRMAVADACYLAFPLRYDSVHGVWEQTGSAEKVCFVMTEQKPEQIIKMIIAYLSDINESKFKYGQFTKEEELRLQQTKELIKKYKENFQMIRIPNPTIELTKSVIRECCLNHDISVVFYDYIFIGPALLGEFKGFNIRNDEALLMFATALKDLAIELDVAVFTSTQVNSKADDNTNIRNEGSLAGGRSTINKADNGAIMARPTKEELEIVGKLDTIEPNLVTDIFKVRSGAWTQVRIWSVFDAGTMRRKDLYITDSRLNAIQDFYDDYSFDVENWEDGAKDKAVEEVKRLNEELKGV